MGEFESVIPTYDGEEHVFLAAHHIVKALEASKNLNDDMRRLLVDLDTHLSAMTKLPETKSEAARKLEEQLKLSQEKVMSWETKRSKIWDFGPEEASAYLHAVYEIQKLTESLRSSLPNESGKQQELLVRARSVLQLAMVRLEEELIHILHQNKQSFDLLNMPPRSCEEGGVVFAEDDSTEDTFQRDSNGTAEPEEIVFDLIHPHVIPHVESIANVMFASRYDEEFCQAFINFWRDEMDEYLAFLGIDTLSIEDWLKMEWGCLTCKIKKWIRGMRTIVQFYLASLKRLFDQMLGECGSVSSTCFIEASKTSMLCLLNFGEAVTIGPRRPEKLFSLLDMYEVLADLLQDIDSLFAEDVGLLVRTEFHELLTRLGDTAKATFMEFGDAVASDAATNPFPGGGIHPLTTYVMNYINLFVVYAGTLNLLLQEQGGEDLVTVCAGEGQNIRSYIFSPVARHLRLVTSVLESNLDVKSGLYRVGSLKHIFMMNNIHYMVRKVKGTELQTFFGDDWVREYTGKFQKHAISYERVTWSPILSLLRVEGNLKQAILKDRYRSFNVAFEEVYKSQKEWSIPDPELRKDLRISTSQTVIPAYRSFTGKEATAISEKYKKYTPDELENHILDLFEGSTRSLQSTRKRLTF